MNILAHMIAISSDAHINQLDKSGKPYILHPLKVMELLNTDDEELMCIAVGHDLFEDTWITPDVMKEWDFSERIINGIRALTKIDGEDYETYKERIKANPDAVKVKIADLKHNTDITRLKGIRDKDIERTRKYYEFYLELIKLNQEEQLTNA